ncbi:IclR family transcriptional regulator [Sphingomonas crocodyli]|uniref:Transcriptional regulator n=1 Tax=Sphingomonas crocodyli TaxID=1979270 RepID=A0A437M6C4_9SPHN|nr:helix-turn-helix domain-containing protein [Sphingomonas crocodyli]RVT93199.1 transcriptional regulator [Sphingomonas crocodyli]
MAKSAPAPHMSPPVARAVAVLNFLASHPEQAFTLTEIAKSLKISSATCHNLLISLSEAEFVYRTMGKTYVLGPALARMAQASLAPALVMQVARPEMRLLADEFDVVCSAYQLVDGESVIRERAAALSHVNWNARYLLNTPTRAPLGGIYFAWQQDELDRWIAEANPPLDAAERDRLLSSLGFLRANGYTFGVRTVPLDDEAVAHALQNRPEMTDYAQTEVVPGDSYNLAYVTAPVFGAPGKVAFGLSLAGFVKPIAGDAVIAMGEKLRAACDRIGGFIAGRAL